LIFVFVDLKLRVFSVLAGVVRGDLTDYEDLQRDVSDCLGQAQTPLVAPGVHMEMVAASLYLLNVWVGAKQLLRAS